MACSAALLVQVAYLGTVPTWPPRYSALHRHSTGTTASYRKGSLSITSWYDGSTTLEIAPWGLAADSASFSGGAAESWQASLAARGA